ncbi:MAG: PqqD family protein [Acidobacteria bacterium]|nr:PqqD family protein [Acidobacteriota bacterium]MYH23129.1 PqqD family protein [Acidobacteriota bacterium]
MVLSLTTVVQRNEAIVFTEIDDIVVMMDVDEGRYYELDAIGARIWALIESGATVTAICDALEQDYEVAPEVCRRDVLDFVAEAHRCGVIRLPAAEDGAAAPASP